MPPFNMTLNGEVGGVATEHLAKALDRAGISYRISVYPWLRAYDMALKDPTTCVYSTNRTPERESLFKWAGPLAEDGWVIFALANSNIEVRSLDDLKGYRIGAAMGDAIALFLHGQGFHPDETVHPSVPANELNLKKLRSGRIDFWAAGRITGTYTAAQFRGVAIKQVLSLKETTLYLACNRGVPDESIDKMNAELRR